MKPVEIRCERFPVLSETFVANEARALARLGHDVVVHAHERGDGGPTGVPATYRDDTTSQRVAALVRLALRHPRGVLGDLAARRRWRREEPVAPLRVLAPHILRRGPRHVHVHFARESALDALREHRITGAAFSVTAHAYDIFAAPANLAEKLETAEFATTGCEYNARHLRTVAPRADLHVVVMGVDPEVFRRGRPHPDAPVVLAVGRLVEKKGFAHLVRAMADPQLRNARLRLIGDGPLRTSLAADAARLGVGERVRLLGSLPPDAVRAQLEEAAVLAMPCVVAADGDRDSMPVVVKEALAMEVPVVATDEVGLPEVVRPQFGRLVAPGDPGALASALAELLALPVSARAQMGARGRAHVERHAALAAETGKLSDLL